MDHYHVTCHTVIQNRIHQVNAWIRLVHSLHLIFFLSSLEPREHILTDVLFPPFLINVLSTSKLEETIHLFPCYLYISYKHFILHHDRWPSCVVMMPQSGVAFHNAYLSYNLLSTYTYHVFLAKRTSPLLFTASTVNQMVQTQYLRLYLNSTI